MLHHDLSLKVLAPTLFLLACGGQSGAATVTGSVSGTTLSPQSAVYDGITGEVIFTTSADPCTDLENGTLRKGSTSLVIATATPNHSSSIINEANVQTGSFPIASARLERLDDTCTDALGATTTTGTLEIDDVHLTSFSAIDSVSGSFDVSFYGQRMTGTFTALHCGLSTFPDTTTCQ